MSQNNSEERQVRGVRLDTSLNIPTLLSLVGTAASVFIYFNGQMTALNNRQLVTEGDVKVLQTQVTNQGAQMSNLRIDTAGQISLFRTEVRQDMKDLKDGMEKLAPNRSGR